MQSPWRLGLALEEIRRSVVAELLDTLATVTPASAAAAPISSRLRATAARLFCTSSPSGTVWCRAGPCSPALSS